MGRNQTVRFRACGGGQRPFRSLPAQTAGSAPIADTGDFGQYRLMKRRLPMLLGAICASACGEMDTRRDGSQLSRRWNEPATCRLTVLEDLQQLAPQLRFASVMFLPKLMRAATGESSLLVRLQADSCCVDLRVSGGSRRVEDIHSACTFMPSQSKLPPSRIAAMPNCDPSD